MIIYIITIDPQKWWISTSVQMLVKIIEYHYIQDKIIDYLLYYIWSVTLMNIYFSPIDLQHLWISTLVQLIRKDN